MFNSPCNVNRRRNRYPFVNLFDSLGPLQPIDQPPNAKKAPIADHGDDIQRVFDVGKRVTVHEHQVRRGADGKIAGARFVVEVPIAPPDAKNRRAD